jgi:hypothetical protein
MKLSKLPDRTPVKLGVTLMPGLAARLRDYAEYYAEVYGVREEVVDLVPFMLTAFLDGDVEFRKAIRAGEMKEVCPPELRNSADRRTRASMTRSTSET